jgi:hypothetical protein
MLLKMAFVLLIAWLVDVFGCTESEISCTYSFWSA